MRGALAFAAGLLTAPADGAFAQVPAAPRPTVPIVLKPAPVLAKPLPMPIAPLATTYQFVATTQNGRPAMQGRLPGGSAWSCDQTRCTMTSSSTSRCRCWAKPKLHTALPSIKKAAAAAFFIMAEFVTVSCCPLL